MIQADPLTPPQKLVPLLVHLEAHMRRTGLCGDIQPSTEALESQEPFACDQMNFSEWLQHLFIPRLFMMVEQQTALPTNSDITPMAEYYFAQKGMNANELIEIIRKIDGLLTQD